MTQSLGDKRTGAKPGASAERVAEGSPLRLLAALALLNVLSYVDRQMVAALAPLLIADLGLSRAQIGLLVGATFIVVFAAATLLMGMAADRLPRPRLLAFGIGVWSLATGLSGTARGFATLAFWRAGVGVGEATLSPTALSMLADRFSPRRLGLANGVFYAGIPLGFACSYALAGAVAPRFGWRACFYALGIAGLAAVALAGRIADSPRIATASRHDALGSLSDLRRLLAGEPSLGVLMLGGALLAYASASSQHGVTWLVQERGFAYGRATSLSALVTAIAGLVGNFAIGALTDRAGRRRRAGSPLAFSAVGGVALTATAAFYTLPATSRFFLPCWFLAQAWLLGWYGPLLAAILERCPAPLRASSAGLALLAINLLGVALGPWLTGWIGDRAGLSRGLLASVAVGAAGLLLVLGVGLSRLRRERAAAA